MNRGEIWLADLGYTGKIRPVLVLSVPPGDNDRALVSYVMRTATLLGSNYDHGGVRGFIAPNLLTLKPMTLEL